MTDVTLQDVINDAMGIIGEVAGSGVQTYGEDRLLRDATRAFNLCLRKHPWEAYREWSDHTLDGTSGIVNADAFQNVRTFEDFLGVYLNGKPNQLPLLPKNINPNTISSSTEARYWTSLPSTSGNFRARRLQFWPKSATSSLNILTRVYPTAMTPDTVVHLDRDMLAFGTAFMALSFDGLQGEAAATCQGLMDMVFNDIMTALSRLPRQLWRGSEIPTEWREQ